MASYFQKYKPVAYIRLFYERATDTMCHKTTYRMVCSLATKPITMLQFLWIYVTSEQAQMTWLTL